jgi:predicted nucleic acid-binding protein
VKNISFLEIPPAIAEIVAVYHEHRLMPKGESGDALHLALASFHKCDYLLTWNCKHLANANKFGHIRRVNGLLRLSTPELVTPLELTTEIL